VLTDEANKQSLARESASHGVLRPNKTTKLTGMRKAEHVTREYLNIVLYVTNFLPHVGGKEFVVYNLACSLQALGHRVRVVGPAGWRTQRNNRFQFPLHRWPAFWGIWREAVRSGEFLLDTAIWGCDVVHAHDTYPMGYTAARLKSFRRLPLVITPHGEDIHVIPDMNRGMRLDPVIGLKIARALQRADRLTAISTSVEASLLDAGAEREKIRPIPNGVDLDRFRRENAMDAHEWLGLPASARLILSVGNYRKFRGHDEIVRAMPRILAVEPDARLVIVGHGTHVLHPLIEELGLAGKVILTGRIDDTAISAAAGLTGEDPGTSDRVAALYRHSSVYVSAGAAEGAEGLSLAVLDSLAAGLPIVATNISGNRDVVRDGDFGYLVAPGNIEELAAKIIRVLGSGEAERRRMSASARTAAQKYEWREIARQYVAVYREAIDHCNRWRRANT
jgi:glycosyltransferase involved in cell wall biosynthesis